MAVASVVLSVVVSILVCCVITGSREDKDE